jgi:hypothetical protein
LPQKILATYATGQHVEYLELTRSTFERYAARHGYEVRVPEVDPVPEHQHKHWGKVAFINQLLPECDELLWIDADAAIVDDSVDLASVLAPRQFLGLVEHRYDGQLVPNTGVMIVRSGALARRFFEEIWGATQYLETRWHDNAAALKLLGYEFDMDATPVRCQPGRSTRWRRRTELLGNEWNSIPQDMADRPRIVHVTSTYPHEYRLEWLRRSCDVS